MYVTPQVPKMAQTARTNVGKSLKIGDSELWTLLRRAPLANAIIFVRSRKWSATLISNTLHDSITQPMAPLNSPNTNIPKLVAHLKAQRFSG